MCCLDPRKNNLKRGKRRGEQQECVERTEEEEERRGGKWLEKEKINSQREEEAR